ncbi:MAG TPA: serine/threonine protein kinase, partial [Deltaproteobacteria bacterium]|nr:serine/threonine protein kinase [Deltaproteobacteria bacterium]
MSPPSTDPDPHEDPVWSAVRSAFQRSPSDRALAEAWIALAIDQARTSEIDEATAALAALPAPPASSLRLLCAIALLQHDTAAALARAEAAVQREPDDPMAWRALAAAHHARGQLEPCTDALRRGIALGDQGAVLALSALDGPREQRVRHVAPLAPMAWAVDPLPHAPTPGSSGEPTVPTLTLTFAGSDPPGTLTLDEPKTLRAHTLTEHAAGERIRDYEVIALAGRGGMGAVYRVSRQDRTFALKTVHTTRTHHIQALQRELALLELVNRADYFPTIHEHFEDDDRLCVVMDWVEGQTLDVWLNGGPHPRLPSLDAPTFLHLMTQLCERLSYLHTWQGQGILFRDLKPRNILIDPDTLQLRLVDFGISHRSDQTLHAGTPRYLAPEVYQGQATVRTDLYSLGRVALFLLFGHEDFDRITAHLRPPHMYERDLDPEVVRAALSLCALAPADRPVDAHEALDR